MPPAHESNGLLVRNDLDSAAMRMPVVRRDEHPHSRCYSRSGIAAQESNLAPNVIHGMFAA
jgi:hypothetical protein